MFAGIFIYICHIFIAVIVLKEGGKSSLCSSCNLRRFIVHKLMSVVLVLVLIFVSGQKADILPASTEKEEIKLVILMYHGFKSQGNESTYVIRADDFENDIIYLKENNFNFVGIRDITDFYDYGKPLPPKPVMLTFDDGYLNNYTFAYPILKKYDAKAVISPIAYYSDYQSENPDSHTAYAHLTWDHIKEMSDSGHIEIQNHSYLMHSLDKKRKGSTKAAYESSQDYRIAFYNDFRKAHNAIKKSTGIAPVAYVYPFGLMTDEADTILKCCGYRLTLSCAEGYNYLTDSPGCLYNLKRFNRTPQRNASIILSGY